MASRGNKSLLNEPTKISSMGQFEELFGGPPPTKFNITMDEENEPQGFKLELNKSTQFNLYYAMRFYFSNGGGDCYIVSVGGYDESIEKDKLNDPKGGGLASLEKHLEPTIIVIPDAVLLNQKNSKQSKHERYIHVDYK